MIQVINRALDLLELIANEPEQPKSLGELADGLSLNHGTCANILKTLVARGYVEQIGTKKGYILGAKSYTLTGNEAYQKDLLEAAREPMETLTRSINENCLLAVLKDNQRVVIHRTFAEQDLQVRTADLKPIYDSASGRLLLAMLPKEKILRFVVKYGLPIGDSWPEIQSEAQLHEALSLIHQEKLALQTIPNRHVIGLAVPIYKNGLVVSSLSIYLPEYRYMTMDKRKLVLSLRKCADEINNKLI
ncbi:MULTISPECIES: IclR family transcriptional regulator C-terminal domain-containing protein [unclassified Spirosoma]|uniref:IclR family transcriptional regulator n=1 Tax=unclassified Spirosoma TaxID=2621999 RepID=UPI00095D79B7|nr:MULTISPECIES: IclR family transcriptional regulator C-terminal domain-containing protein [unclassified Spirosoma]MBN8825727.1 helix-turn-helix domain-containing protein [Spirosoma sp.]OJW76583.1 MAG: IclR family transcriptional regulator [Spirosoma sp. 48-14]